MPLKGQRTGYTIKCENCGKEVYQTKTQYNRAKHHFCSNKCQKEFQHKILFENRKCLICNKIFETSKKSHKMLCSVTCQKKWQTQRIGIKNPKFKRQKINCEQCGTTFYVQPYKIKNGQHNFCSNICRRDWYRNIWSQQEDWKEESKKRAVRILSSGKISFTQSSPQLIVNKMLEDIKVKYKNEYSCIYYSIDNYLNEYNLMIEVMGDFWHCNPLKFKTIKQDVQIKRIPKDKAKHTYIKNKYNIEILYLWEDDINNRYDICCKLIELYINSKGILNNYHSFNYILDNTGNLKLRNIIITPYQDMTKEELNTFKTA